MRRSLLAAVLLLASLDQALADGWQLHRDTEGTVRLLLAGTPEPATLVLSCRSGSGVLEWQLMGLRPRRPGSLSVGNAWIDAGPLQRLVRFPVIVVDGHMTSPTTDRMLPGPTLVRARPGQGFSLSALTDGNLIRIGGPPLDASTLLSHARAAALDGHVLTIRMPRDLALRFDVTDVDAATARLAEACVGPLD